MSENAERWRQEVRQELHRQVARDLSTQVSKIEAEFKLESDRGAMLVCCAIRDEYLKEFSAWGAARERSR